MIELNIKKFKVKYALTTPKDKNSLLNPGIYLTLCDEEENCQIVFIKDDTKAKDLLLQIIGLTESNSLDEIRCGVLEKEIKMVVLSGEKKLKNIPLKLSPEMSLKIQVVENNDFHNQAIAIVKDFDYGYVMETHGMVNPGKVKRPVLLAETGRSMLEVCVEDFDYTEEVVEDLVEETIFNDLNNQLLKRG